MCMFISVKRIEYKQVDKAKLILSINFINKKIKHDHVSGWAYSLLHKRN